MTNKQAYVGLLPCPFCGGEAKRFTIEEPGDNFGGDVICCQKCGASSHVEFGRKENLVSRWNTRPEAAEAISSLLKRVGELEGALTGWSNAMRLSGVWPVKDANDPFQALLFDTHAALNSDAPLSIGEGDRG